MSNTVIKVENLSKQYRLGEVGTGTISHDLNRWWHRVRGKEDPYLRIGEENDRSQKANSDYVWALRDVSFEVQRGDILGIIGRNGAGKSTLLKLLSRVTAPTIGSMRAKGRIASLLEVGTGFHPELTGRENTYLNGAILGMTKAEIKKKFDEIVSFAGVERYIDTPVKRYSSGMSVRLAFAVAAHLESEILIVDEVLAVGDAEFQKKCFGLMNDLNREKAKTVLIVSHQLNQIKAVCNKTLMVHQGKLHSIGDTDQIIKTYLDFGKRIGSWNNEENKVYNSIVNPLKISFLDEASTSKTLFSGNETIQVLLEFNVFELLAELIVGIALYASDGNLLFWSTHKDTVPESWPTLQLGINKMKFSIPQRVLNEGSYFVEFFSAIHYREWLTAPDGNGPRADFEVKGGLSDSPSWQTKRPGVIAPVIQSTLIN